MRISRKMGVMGSHAIDPNLYVWDVYNVNTDNIYRQTTTTSSNGTTSIAGSCSVYTSYRFGTDDGRYYYSGTYVGALSSINASSINGNYAITFNGVSYMNKFSSVTNVVVSGSYVQFNYSSRTEYSSEVSGISYSRGSATGETVQAYNINAYPADGKQGNRWYIRR